MTAAGVAAGLALLTVAPTLRAQIAPNADWRTLTTAHFRVHSAAALEPQARRAAINAERAYAQLARELHEPRAPIDLVLSDDADFSNGFATPVPSNRIVVYARPPLDVAALRFYDEWSALVITHELTHVFHLDRARGLWRLAQTVFGRNPLFFPNLYAPAWLTEGLAVYYESRLTGAGRIEGSEHRMIARAAALGGGFPPLGALSLVTSRYPYGESAYAFGSLFLDYLARTRGDSSVGRFVEAMSTFPVPFFLDAVARRGFGVAFDVAYRAWRDSLAAEVGRPRPPLSGWRDLTAAGRDAAAPRWLDDASLVYAAGTGRETPGAYVVDTAGHVRRIGRRNGIEPNAVLADGGLLYAQLDYTDPYHIRSDLYVEQRGQERRLTRGARLARGDARRRDGAIVAVQTTPFATSLVRVDPASGAVSPLVRGSPDLHWTEPRWSPDGTEIAAARWERGGMASIVVLDTLGRVRRELFRARAVVASPAWTADGRRVLFASDAAGAMNVYETRADTGTGVRRLSDAQTGLADPEPSPGGGAFAATYFRADGYHIGVAPISPADAVPALSLRGGGSPALTLPPPDSASGPFRAYTAWPTLRPRYWYPIAGQADAAELLVGGGTTGSDVIGRHAYAALFTVRIRTAEIEGGATYRWRGLGNPVLDAGVDQSWEVAGPIVRATGPRSYDRVGTLRRRTRTALVAVTVERPRARTAAYVTAGGGVEWRDFATEPADLLAQLVGFDPALRAYPTAYLSAGWTNAQHPPLAISPEDGVGVGATVRQRWRPSASDGTSRLALGVLTAYKSLDLPGFAHHALALRLAGAIEDERAPSEFVAGGTNGSGFDLLPGLTLGSTRRPFGVRGFPSGARRGIRAAGATAEYRLPLGAPSRGVPIVPAFLDRLSLAVFGEGAAAWCPRALPTAGLCDPTSYEARWVASVGGEFDLDTALEYDVPFRVRLGAAAPVVDHSLLPVSPMSVYFALGISF